MAPLRHQPCRVLVISALFLCHAAVTTSSNIESQYANAPTIGFEDVPKHFPQLHNKRDDNSSIPFLSPSSSTTFVSSESPTTALPVLSTIDTDFYSSLIASSQDPVPNSDPSPPMSSPTTSSYEQVSTVAPSPQDSPKSSIDIIPSTSQSPNDRPTLAVSSADREPLSSPTGLPVDTRVNTQISLGPDILSALKSAFPGVFTSLPSTYIYFFTFWVSFTCHTNFMLSFFFCLFI